MGKLYRNPPVVEAVCEFRFDPTSPWDMAMPGLLYERLRVSYPERDQVRAIESTVEVADEGVHQKVAQSDRVRFIQEGGKALVQVGEHFLAVNHLAYPTWEKFRPMVREAADAYIDVANPTGVQRIGLRYINRIVIPKASVELKDYFRFYPELGDELPENITNFIVGVVFPHAGGRDLLRLQLASGEGDQPDTVVSILDLDYFLARSGEVRFDGLDDWLETAHERVEAAFEGCLKQALREMFEEVT